MTSTNPISKIPEFDLINAYIRGMLSDYDRLYNLLQEQLCWGHIFESLEQFKKFQTEVGTEPNLRISVVYGPLPSEFPGVINSYFVRGVGFGKPCNVASHVNLTSIGLVADLDGNICDVEEAERKFENLKASKKRKSTETVKE